jgi:hypothetical protein
MIMAGVVQQQELLPLGHHEGVIVVAAVARSSFVCCGCVCNTRSSGSSSTMGNLLIRRSGHLFFVFYSVAAAVVVSRPSSSPPYSTSTSSSSLLYCTTYTEMSFLFRRREPCPKYCPPRHLPLLFLGIITIKPLAPTNRQAVFRYGGHLAGPNAPFNIVHHRHSPSPLLRSGSSNKKFPKSAPPHTQQRQRSMAHQ